MVISPIKAAALTPVIEEALEQASQTSDRLKPYSQLTDDQKIKFSKNLNLNSNISKVG